MPRTSKIRSPDVAAVAVGWHLHICIFSSLLYCCIVFLSNVHDNRET